MNEPRQELTKDRVFFALILISGIIVAGLGISAFIGWITGFPVLAAFLPEKIPMAPSTALLFILYGIGLIILTRQSLNRTVYRANAVIGMTGTFACLILFILSLSGKYSGIERLGIKVSGMVNGVPVGHMSPLTAFCFVITGLTFLSLIFSSGIPRRLVAAIILSFLTILISCSLLLAYSFGTPILYGGSVIPPALPTSLAFFSLGIGLFLSSLQKADHGMPDTSGAHASFMLLLIFLSLAAGILTAGYLYFRTHEKHYLDEVGQELTAIKDLKVSELAQWRKERLDDAAILFRNASFSKLVIRYLKNPKDHDAQDQLLEWMSKFRDIDEFNQIRLMDVSGETLLSVPPKLGRASAGELKDNTKIIQTGRPSITDFYQSINDQRVYLAVKVPILDEQKRHVLGILSLRLDPEEYLYPLIQHWPTPSETGETLIIRREGDEVLFLNELRHIKNTAFSLRFPLAEKELPAAMAVRGITGIVEGLDYRGVPVVASIGAIPDSPWFIVSKVDKDEIYAMMRERLWIVVILVGLLLLGSGLGIGLVWRQQRAIFYKERYQAELQLNEDLRKAKEKIKQYNRELKRSNEELQQFAYIASHDLQEPLRMIASYLQLIERRYKGRLDSDADEFIGFAVEGANRLQEMIVGLLTYSRVGTKGKEFEEVNTAEVFGKAVANIKIAIEESGALITADRLPVVKADDIQLLQVFQNLLTNSMKFRGSKAPRIHLSGKPILDFGDRILDLTDTENPEVQNLNSKIPNAYLFTVNDNGIGIPAEYKDRIFNIFQRLHGREYPGVGIGLSICRRIIERHGGKIWFESEEGKGTTFYFTIPIKG